MASKTRCVTQFWRLPLYAPGFIFCVCVCVVQWHTLTHTFIIIIWFFMLKRSFFHPPPLAPIWERQLCHTRQICCLSNTHPFHTTSGKGNPFISWVCRFESLVSEWMSHSLYQFSSHALSINISFFLEGEGWSSPSLHYRKMCYVRRGERKNNSGQPPGQAIWSSLWQGVAAGVYV